MFYDEKYLHFYKDRLTEKLSDSEVEVLVDRLTIQRNSKVLDIGCGHGRIANRLAAKGVIVTGIDLSDKAIVIAEQEADRQTLAVTYELMDMKTLPASWSEKFDRIFVWFSTLGVLSSDDVPEFLRRVYRCLTPGGIFAADQLNKATFLRREFPIIESHIIGHDIMVNKTTFNVEEESFETIRTTVIDGDFAQDKSINRVYSIPELRKCAFDAGFNNVKFTNFSGDAVTIHDQRFIFLAYK